MMKNIGVIVAAGFGRRFGYRLPKQYYKVYGREILVYSALAFEREKIIDGILFVVGNNFIDFVKENIVKKHNFKKVIDVINGGKERFDSVYNAVRYLTKINPENVLIHDGARPFISNNLIKKIVNDLKIEKGVIPVIKISSTLKKVKGRYILETLNRNYFRLAATPQGFKFDILQKLYTKKFINKIKPTDESYAFEKAGIKVKTIEEDERNIKITTKNDIELIKTTLK
jgi:2-C-methyl-D-erythritol 4-phosphate cytidylyltransferase